jgi:hypothetical protein
LSAEAKVIWHDFALRGNTIPAVDVAAVLTEIAVPDDEVVAEAPLEMVSEVGVFVAVAEEGAHRVMDGAGEDGEAVRCETEAPRVADSVVAEESSQGGHENFDNSNRSSAIRNT